MEQDAFAGSEHATWLTAEVEGEETRKRYQYFMRPEPLDRELGPIEEDQDDLTGTVVRFREAWVSPTRNTDQANKNRMLVYLDPLPHIRITNAKDLQGWYQSKDLPTGEKIGGRPRPCMTDAILTEPYGGYCTVGCSFSLPAGAMVDTPNGQRPIESIAAGELVWGRFNFGRSVARVIASTAHWKEEGLVRVRLSDGRELRMTGDHPVYSVDRSTWVRAEALKAGDRLERFNESQVVQALSYRPTVWKEDSVRSVSVGNSRAQRSQATHSPSRAAVRTVHSSLDQQPKEGLRRLLVTSEGRQRSETNRQSRDAWTQDSRNPCADERGSTSATGEHVTARFRTEDSGVARRGSRARAVGLGRLPVLGARRVHMQAREKVLNALGVGAACGGLAGQARLRMGVRARSVEVDERVGVLTGLSAGQRTVHRGEGLSHEALLGEDRVHAVDGPACVGLESAEAGAIGDPLRVVSVESEPEGVRVYDIQTSSGNFYLDGVLVSNCYINSGLRGYRGSGLISVPINYGTHVRKQLAKCRTATAGYFSSFTDPFLPLEDLYHNTQDGAREFDRAGLPVFFLSRLQYPGWAYDLLAKNKYSYAQKSINAPDEATWRKLSPGAISLADHFEEIRALKRRGIYVSIQCNPILPGIVSHEGVRQLFEQLADAGVDHVIVKFVEASYPWAPEMIERQHKRFGKDSPKVAEFERLFTDNIGGQRTISEAYRIEGHTLYRAWATALGMTYATCYEYRYERDPAGNIVSKRGISIGRDYLTGDQCHGHRVPMFTRKNVNQVFAEVSECPPQGCLDCASPKDNSVPCGSDLFGSAPALRMKDLKRWVYE